MKTRIISGLVMSVIVAAILTVGYLWAPVAITVLVALLAVAVMYELVRNAAGIKNIFILIGACAYAAITVVAGDIISLRGIVITTVLYCIYAVVMILINHKQMDLGKIAITYALPVPFVITFHFLNVIISNDNGIYYLLLLLNFSPICDMGAYFTGVTIGKHKLCPEISPKKTVEGAIGGIVSSIIFTVIITLLFGKFSVTILLLTLPFCILGIIGDLFASAIKRSVGIKDYSNIIPGHGGILDRLDSIIMIVPFMYICLILGVIK